MYNSQHLMSLSVKNDHLAADEAEEHFLFFPSGCRLNDKNIVFHFFFFTIQLHPLHSCTLSVQETLNVFVDVPLLAICLEWILTPVNLPHPLNKCRGGAGSSRGRWVITKAQMNLS